MKPNPAQLAVISIITKAELEAVERREQMYSRVLQVPQLVELLYANVGLDEFYKQVQVAFF